MTYWYVWVLMAIMLGAGLLGGAINHFLMQEDDAAPRAYLGRNLLVGVGASFMVPLFLNMVSSDLVRNIRTGGADAGQVNSYLVFAGFCLVAAISSRAFIRTLSDRVLREVREAKQDARDAKAEAANVQAVIDPFVSKETEADTDTGDRAESLGSRSALSGDRQLDEAELSVLLALSSGRWTLRSLGGLAKETHLVRDEVRGLLARMLGDGLVGVRDGQNGPRWFITARGRTALQGRGAHAS